MWLIDTISNYNLMKEVTQRVKIDLLLFPISQMVCSLLRIKFTLYRGKQGLHILQMILH